MKLLDHFKTYGVLYPVLGLIGAYGAYSINQHNDMMNDITDKLSCDESIQVIADEPGLSQFLPMYNLPEYKSTNGDSWSIRMLSFEVRERNQNIAEEFSDWAFFSSQASAWKFVKGEYVEAGDTLYLPKPLDMCGDKK